MFLNEIAINIVDFKKDLFLLYLCDKSLCVFVGEGHPQRPELWVISLGVGLTCVCGLPGVDAQIHTLNLRKYSEPLSHLSHP